MAPYELAFYVAWVLAIGYVLSNRYIVKKMQKSGNDFYTEYQHASSFARSNMVVALLMGRYKVKQEIVPDVNRQILISRTFFVLCLMAFLAFSVLLFST